MLRKKATKKQVAPKKRRPPAALTFAPGSKEAIEQRITSREGKEALRRLGTIIVQSFVDHLTPEEREFFDTPAGEKAFFELWPEIVTTFLQSAPAAGKGRTNKAAKSSARKSKSEPA